MLLQEIANTLPKERSTSVPQGHLLPSNPLQPTWSQAHSKEARRAERLPGDGGSKTAPPTPQEGSPSQPPARTCSISIRILRERDSFLKGGVGRRVPGVYSKQEAGNSSRAGAERCGEGWNAF